jgi:hypothetical protein
MCLPVSQAKQVTFSLREETSELEGKVVGLKIEPQFLQTKLCKENKLSTNRLEIALLVPG